MLFSSKAPNWRKFFAALIPELPFSLFVVVVLLFFTYGVFVRAPYTGFYFNPTDGSVLDLFVRVDSPSSLRLDDILVKIGPLDWQDYYEDGTQGLFDDVQAGDVIDIVVRRNGAELTIPWRIAGFNSLEFSSRFVNVWWLAYVFWFFGSATQYFIRPKDTRWWLLVAANYLTGLWLIFGCLSGWHLWASSILLHATTWLIMPVYLHLHWIFPQLLRPIPKFAGVLFYAISILLALGELVQALPRSFYVMGFLLAFAGSVLLQIIHFIWRPAERRQIGFLVVAILLVVAPSISLSIGGLSGVIPQAGIISFLGLPFMPLAYFYVIYRGQIGGLEVRASRLLSIYAFLILLGALLLLLIGPATLLSISHEATIFLTVVIASLTAFLSILVFPAFQAFVEKRFLGIRLPYENLREAYSARIIASASITGLLQLLEEVLPSLFVRQFAFIQIFNNRSRVLFTKGIAPDRLPAESDLKDLIAQAGKFRPEASPGNDSLHSWVRIILPLKMDDELIGLWLLGRRDPDDFYHQSEILILQSIANQTAIALSNIQHAEQLRKMYQMDIERYEKERLRLALDLHDSILNQLAVLRTNLDDAQLSPKFHGAYEELTQRLREIVSDLRPPMLMYGLKPAIEELADNLMQRSGDRIKITVDVQAGGERVPQNIEQHLFRIVQEACENALRHAQAQSIKISGTLNTQKADLTIEDNGMGFDIGEQLELGNLLANNHFGLAGIVERVSLIGAEINTHSTPETGTKIQVVWMGDPNEN